MSRARSDSLSAMTLGARGHHSVRAPFGDVLTAMATAFHADGSVDLDGTARIAAHLVDHGHDGVVVSGTTGESPTTTTEEDGAILAAVRDAVGDRATIVAGVGTNATAHSVELAEQAAKIGADGLLLVTPYYNKPGQAGVLHHFRSVADATDVPVMLYDVPGRTGTQIALETYEQAIALRAGRRGQGRRRRLRRAASSSRSWATPSTPATTSAPSAGSPTAPSASSPSSATRPATRSRPMIDAFLRRRPRRRPRRSSRGCSPRSTP